MSNTKKITIIGSVFLFCLPFNVFADTIPFGIQYISPAAQDWYDIHLVNGGIDISALKIFIDGEQKDNTIQKKLDGDILKIPDFLKTGADIYITKISDSIDGTTKVEERSTTIKMREENKTMFSQKITTTNILGKNMTVLWFKDPIENFELLTASIDKKYTININGTDYDLVKNLGGSSYDDGIYYMSDKYVIFPSNNLTLPYYTIKLKIDGIFSNYVVIKKELYKLEKPTNFEFKDISNSYSIKWTFNIPDKIIGIQNFDFYINGAILDKKAITVFMNQVIIDYPLSSLISGGNGVTEIYLKDPMSNYVSNSIYLKADDYIGLNINKVSLGDGKNPNFLFTIEGTNNNGFLGTIMDLIVNINGQDYTRFGVQTPAIKSYDGTEQQDKYGNTIYETKYAIDLEKKGMGLAFNFYYTTLKDGENIVYVKNNLTGKTSNSISFTKGNYSNINYSYGATVENTTYSENMSFEKGAETESKKVDFLYSPMTDIVLGKVNFNNFKTSDLYNVSFKIKSNLKINPFKDILLNSIIFTPKIESDGFISYEYNQVGLGSIFVSNNIVFNLNEYYNVDGNIIGLTISDFFIKKVGIKSDTTVYSSNSSSSINISYKYEFGNCFDGGKDYCSLMKIVSPYLSFGLTYGKSTVATITNTTTKTTTNTTINNKKNIPRVKLLIITSSQKEAIIKRISNFSTDKINTIITKIEKLLTKNLSIKNQNILKDVRTLLQVQLKTLK